MGRRWPVRTGLEERPPPHRGYAGTFSVWCTSFCTLFWNLSAETQLSPGGALGLGVEKQPEGRHVDLRFCCLVFPHKMQEGAFGNIWTLLPAFQPHSEPDEECALHGNSVGVTAPWW